MSAGNPTGVPQAPADHIQDLSPGNSSEPEAEDVSQQHGGSGGDTTDSSDVEGEDSADENQEGRDEDESDRSEVEREDSGEQSQEGSDEDEHNMSALEPEDSPHSDEGSPGINPVAPCTPAGQQPQQGVASRPSFIKKEEGQGCKVEPSVMASQANGGASQAPEVKIEGQDPVSCMAITTPCPAAQEPSRKRQRSG